MELGKDSLLNEPRIICNPYENILQRYFTSHTEANSKYIKSLSKEGKESEVTLSCLTLFDPCWAVAHQAPVSMEFSRQEYQSGLPFPFPGAVYLADTKSLQLCLTLCNPIDGSPPGSPVPGILQARTLEWVAISFSNA